MKKLFLLPLIWLLFCSSLAAHAAPQFINPDGYQFFPTFFILGGLLPPATEFNGLAGSAGSGGTTMLDLERSTGFNEYAELLLPMASWLSLLANFDNENWDENLLNPSASTIILNTNASKFAWNAGLSIFSGAFFYSEALWGVNSNPKGFYYFPRFELYFGQSTANQASSGSGEALVSSLNQHAFEINVGIPLPRYFYFSAGVRNTYAYNASITDLAANASQRGAGSSNELDMDLALQAEWNARQEKPDFGKNANPGGWLWSPQFLYRHRTHFSNQAPQSAVDEFALQLPLTTAFSVYTQYDNFHYLSDTGNFNLNAQLYSLGFSFYMGAVRGWQKQTPKKPSASAIPDLPIKKKSKLDQAPPFQFH